MSSGPPQGGGLPGPDGPDDPPSLPDPPPAAADPANLEYSRKATDLVLERLKHQQQDPDPELLKSLGWTKEEMRQFIARWEELKRAAREEGPQAQADLDDALRSLGLRATRLDVRRGSAENDQQRGQSESGHRESSTRRIPGAVQRLQERCGARRPRGRWTQTVNDEPHRYLVPFHPKQIPHFFTDVLIIGAGLAGLRAAIAVDPKLSVLVLTKDRIDESSSNYAQGGIAGVLDPEDCFDEHVADTLDRRRRAVRSGSCVDGRAGSARADPRTDRLGHQFRREVGRTGAGTGRWAQSQPRGPRHGGRHGPGDHAGHDLLDQPACGTCRSASTRSRSTC